MRWWSGQYWGSPKGPEVNEALALKCGVDWLPPEVEAWSAQIERGDEEGNVHLQWCAKFTKSRDHTWVLNKLGMNDGHGFAAPSRDLVAAWEYTQKEDTRIQGPWTHGSGPVRAMKRSRSMTNAETREILTRTAADPTTTVLELASALDASAYSYQALEKSLALVRVASVRPCRDMPSLYWRWGAARSGKTSWGPRTFGEEACMKIRLEDGGKFPRPPSAAETVLLLDEVDKYRVPWETILMLGEVGLKTIRWMYGSGPSPFKAILLTSNRPPSEVVTNHDVRAGLLGRGLCITKCVKVGEGHAAVYSEVPTTFEGGSPTEASVDLSAESESDSEP